MKNVSRTIEERNRMIEQHLPLVRFAVGKMHTVNGMDYDDLVGHGTLGLIQAVDRFDDSQEVQFSYFALSRIRGAALDAMRALDPVGRSSRLMSKKVDSAFNRLSLDLGREPTHSEVQHAAGVGARSYWSTHAASNRAVVSFDEVVGDGLNWADRVADDLPPASARLEGAELSAALAQAISLLPGRDRLVLSLYFVEQLSMKNVAKIMDISETRVSQLLNRSYERLRANRQLAAAA